MPLDPSRKNVVVIGDSLTIGYTPIVARLLNDIALVQHVPWDVSDGGAEETEYGLQCLDLWLASPSGMPIHPDLIYFNFGMHDLVTNCTPGHGCVPGQSGNTSVYPGELEAIARKLQLFSSSLTPPAKLIFGITTPYICNAALDAIISGNLNVAAASIMRRLSIPTVDLYGAAIAWCGGTVPNNACHGIGSCFCPHCSSPGYDMLASTVIAPAIRRALTA